MSRHLPASSPDHLLDAVIPVLDILQGQAVHAVRGDRTRYRPLGETYPVSSDPVALAARFARRFSRLYLADLDAIAGASPNWMTYRAVRAAGLECWVDWGIRRLSQLKNPCLSPVSHRQCLSPIRPVIGLETIADPQEFTSASARTLCHNALFSIDLKHGKPIRSDDELPTFEWVNLARAAGIRQMIVLDLAAVGSSEGPAAVQLCRDLSTRFPDVDFFLGGGIRDLGDVASALDAGCRGVLIATALHGGGIDWKPSQQVPPELRP